MLRRLRQIYRFVTVALAARRIQDHLWNKPGERVEGAMGGPAEWGNWVQNLYGRVDLLTRVDPSRPHWQVTARKRLLQIATVAVAMSEAIDAGAIKPPAENRQSGR